MIKGCLEHDVRNRWTIVMVDEMAWDIGWGQVDDSSSVSHADKFEFVDFPNQSTRRHPRSRSCDHNSTFGPPTSRPRRSLSRTSITTSSSLSSRSTSRSVSRPPTTAHLPLATACDYVGHAVLGAPTAVSSHTPLDIGGSALMSPTSPVERGRSLRKADSNRFAPSIGASTARSDLGRESSRGQEMFSGTDVLANTARWASTLGLNTIAEVTTHLNGVSSPAVERLRKIQNENMLRSGESNSTGSKRAGSTPPVSSAWSLRRSPGVKEDPPSLRLGDSLGVGGAFLREPSATPISIARKTGTRSRSVGYELDSTARRHF